MKGDVPARLSADGPAPANDSELTRLYRENRRLQDLQQTLYGYIRSKTNQLLDVIGTSPLAAQELTDDTLLRSDPIGTVADAFRLIIDHLHQTNDRMALANQEIRAIVDTAGAGIMVVDREGRIITVNHRTKELFGCTPESAVGQRCADLICKAGGRPPVCALDEVVVKGRAECRVEWDQGEHCFEVVGRPIRSQGAEISHVVIVYSDVTQRKRNEEALRSALDETRNAHAQTEGILHSVADGLLVTDLQQRIVLMNPIAERLLGLHAADLPLTLAQAIPDSGLQQALENVFTGGSTDRIDFLLPGSKTICEGNVSQLRRADGVIAGNIVVIRDVTLARTVERMKSEFVSTAAHEFRTPLAAILGFTELLLEPEERSEEERTEFLQLVHEKAEALARMVNNLLDISRIESGEELPLDRGPNLLGDLLGQVLPLFQKRSGPHRFEVALPPHEVVLDVDPDTVEQLFENIIGNAVKYSPAGGLIRIAAEVVAGECRLSVSDQGIGMTAVETARVFDKFFRADGSNTAIRGTGLGMTIVRHIVEAHGGRIWIESVKGQGTTVCFTLPLAVNADN